MADVVQFRLERMANELDDLERRGLIEHDKIREIAKQRREFEYRLQRPSPLKQDFLSYIEYEKKFEAYRKLRKRMIIRQMEEEEDEREGGKKKRRKKWKKSISDFAGILRILDLYRMAVMRFKGDLGLWFQYLEFCRERRHGQMKEALGQALKLHPKVPGLWIYAAAWEFDNNLNIVAARALMQSGLRACPNSEDIWIEYLRLELTYLNKLKARKEALGEDLQTLERGSTEVRQWKEDNMDLFMSLDTENSDEKNDKKGSDLEGGHEEKQNIFWQLGSMVLETIYHEAIKAIPSSINLRKQFLEVLRSVDLVHSDELRMEILKDLRKDFSYNELYWDMIARLQISDIDTTNDEAKYDVLSKLKQAFQVYEEALNVLPSVKMFSLFVKFWSDVACPESMIHKVGLEISEFSLFLKRAFKKAESTGCLIEDLACQYISFYLHAGKLDKARKVAEELCSGKLSDAATVWLLRISIEINCLANKTSSISKDDFDYIFQLLERALNRLSLSKSEGLWFMALKVFSCHKAYFKRLVKILEGALARCSSNCEFSISAAVVDRTLQSDGILRARILYKRTLPPFEGGFESILSPREHTSFNGNARAEMKLVDENNTPQETMDIENMLCDPDRPLQEVSAPGDIQIGQESSPTINRRQSLSTIAEDISILEGGSYHRVEPLVNSSSTKLNFPDLEASDVIRSPVLNPEPAPPVKRRNVKKRKKIEAFDKQLVLSNMQMKKQLSESSSIVCKRRKLPCSDLDLWKSQRFRTKEAIFGMPLLSRMDTRLVEALERTYPRSIVDNIALETPGPLSAAPEGAASEKEKGTPTIDAFSGIEKGRDGGNMEDLIAQFTLDQIGFGSESHKDNNSETILRPSATEISPPVEPIGLNLETPPFHLRQHNLDDMEVPEAPGLLDSADDDLSFLNANGASPGLQEAFKVENLSARTRAVAKYFKDNSEEAESDESGRISLNSILEQKNRKQCARMFFETLVLKSYSFINVEQKEAYGDILISPTPALFSTKF